MRAVRYGRSILRTVLASILLIAACSGGGTSDRCREICKIDNDCHNALEEDERTYKFDRDECEKTCMVLERDPTGRDLVKSHVACVRAAGEDCTAVRACN